MKDFKINNKAAELDFEAIMARNFSRSKDNVNNLSYWYPKVKDCGINVPETVIIPIDIDQFKWFIGDRYSADEVKQLGDYINKHIENSILKDRKLFVKTGTFSNKFQFNTCKVDAITNIGDNFLSVYYAGMCVGAGESTEIVVREFLESDNDIKTIYNGMPLNSEFRVFYDFDNHEVLGVFNYWDREVMSQGLKRGVSEEDYKTFMSYADSIDDKYNKYKDIVVELVKTAMAKVELDGAWSVDIMYTKGEFYLIDMATAKTSYYYDKLQTNK